MARRMVLEWGMGDTFQHQALTTNNGPVFLGEDMAQRKEFSEHTARLVDEDVKRILDRAYTRAKQLVAQYGGAMHDVAEALLTNELITGDVVRGAVEKIQNQLQPSPNPAD